MHFLEFHFYSNSEWIHWKLVRFEWGQIQLSYITVEPQAESSTINRILCNYFHLTL